MRPVILEPLTNAKEGYLVDLDCVIYGKEDNSNKINRIFLRAVKILNLKAGELRKVKGEFFPMPCQLVQSGPMKRLDTLSRQIYPDAAEALLSMPLGFKPYTVGTAFHPGKTKAGFNQWSFLIAWRWSVWQANDRSGNKTTLECRWKEMQALGYPHGCPAFRKACAGMGLFVTTSSPNR